MIFATPPAEDPGMKRLVDDLNRFHPTVDRWPVFADDAAAKAANLKVGYPYVTPDGFCKRRMA